MKSLTSCLFLTLFPILLLGQEIRPVAEPYVVDAQGQSPNPVLSWLDGDTVDSDYGGYKRDYFFQYFIPEQDGFIDSIQFMMSDLPDTTLHGITIWVYSLAYDWPEIHTGSLADHCIDGNLGYYDESTGLEVIGMNWVQGGINSTAEASPDFNYDPLGVYHGPFSYPSISLPQNSQDAGMVTLDYLSAIGTRPVLTANVPIGVLVRINASIYDPPNRIGFNAKQLEHEPQPGLKFYSDFGTPNGRCGEADFGWYITSYAWDWRVHVSYTVNTDPKEWIPGTFALASIFPNPANPSTTITYELPQVSDVSVTIYDLAGRQVWSRDHHVQSTGRHSLQWEGVNQDGAEVTSGVYIVQLSTPEWSESRKVVVLR